MAKRSLIQENEQPATLETEQIEVPVEQTSQEVAVVDGEQHALSTHIDDGSITGCVDSRAIQLPRLTLTQAKGLGERVGKVGRWFIGENIMLPMNFRFIPLRGHAFYSEDSKDMSHTPLTAKDPAAVAQMGGTIDRNVAKATGKTLFLPAAKWVVLVEECEAKMLVGEEFVECDKEVAFPVEVAGKRFALVTYWDGKTRYQRFTGVIRSDSIQRRKSVYELSYSANAEKKEFASGSAFNPILAFNKKVEGEELEAIMSLKDGFSG